MACRVVRVPGQNTRDRGVHARGHEEGHPVLDFGGGSDADDGIADNGNREGGEHDGSAQGQAVGHEGCDDGEESGDGVGDYGPELCFVGVGGEAAFDDSGQKEAERVKTAQDAEVSGCAEPDL